MTTVLQRKAGTTDVSVIIRIIDSADGTPETGVTSATSGIDLEYRREGAAVVNITEADLSALTDAHADGGMLHISGGYYRLDLPDAAVAAGATGVLVAGTITDMVVIGCYVQLVAYDPFDTVRLGLTALPNAAADAAGGLPISDAGGLDLDAILADTNELQTDWANNGRLDLILDARASQTTADAIETDTQNIQSRVPTALSNGRMVSDVYSIYAEEMAPFVLSKLYSYLAASGEVQAATTTTVDIENYSGDDDTLNGQWIGVHGVSVGDEWEWRRITDYNSANGRVTVDRAWTNVPANRYVIVPAASLSSVERVEAVGITEIQSGLATSANQTTILADTNELQTDWADGGRLDLILDARASQTSVDDLPTNAELTTALGTADDATLAAIAALNDLSGADVRTAVGLASANLDTQLDALPTAAENATAAATAVAAIVIETGYDLADVLKLVGAATAGKLSGAATTTNTIRSLDDSADRITATVDSDGNRTAVTHNV